MTHTRSSSSAASGPARGTGGSSDFKMRSPPFLFSARARIAPNAGDDGADVRGLTRVYGLMAGTWTREIGVSVEF
jgi:hypothetical protein